jgi:hypothetical protein
MNLLAWIFTRSESRKAGGLEDCEEFCVWGHSRTAGGGLLRSRRTHWTNYFRGVIQRKCFPRMGFSMS